MSLSPSPEVSSDPFSLPQETPPPSPSLMFDQSDPPPMDPFQDSPEGSWASHDTHGSPEPDDGSDSSAPSNKKAVLRVTTRNAVKTIGGMAHRTLTQPNTAEREVGLFKPDGEDVKAIGDPLASLASRRAPEGADNPDVNDILQLVLGVVGYATKQRDKLVEARQYAPLDHQHDQGDESGADG